ncbi:hypothetical protein RND81_01G003000 [Saponaria officinalis]|uniref:Syringolide-induced protein 14-1-1 n=1 Tax=Saponaria officinalis TaxID=3572 RepID=A0AAW1NAN6_SAPOF
MDNNNNNKSNKHKNSFLKFLPKAASAVSFQNPSPFSPGRDHHHKSHAYKGFSGPINFAGLPDEAREKPKNGEYGSQEPTSPKISCMGQIKCKHKKKNKLLKQENKNTTNKSNEAKKSSKFFSMKKSRASGATRDNNNNNNNNNNSGNNNKGMMPTLGQMRKFASGRETTLGNFDWTAQIAPIDHDDHDYDDRECFSDEERRRRRRNGDDDDEKEVIIPFSAPMMLGGGNIMSLKPRTEVNLWKRRTMGPPPPLALLKS